MTAERAISSSTGEDWLLEGNVRGTRKSSDFTFRTSSLHYTPEGKKIWGKERVQVEYAGLWLEGVGFELDLEIQRLYVEKEVMMKSAPAE